MRTLQDYKFLAVQQHELISRMLAGQEINHAELKAIFKTGAGVFSDKEVNHLLKMAGSFDFSHEVEAREGLPGMLRKQHF